MRRKGTAVVTPGWDAGWDWAGIPPKRKLEAKAPKLKKKV
jgi:hypothetical protein